MVTNTEVQLPQRVVFVFDLLTRSRFAVSASIFNMTLVALARTGAVERMQAVLKQMQEQHVPISADSHNAVLLHLTKTGKLDEAVAVLATLMHEHVPPNTTFTSMLLGALVDQRKDHQVLNVLRLLRPLGRRALLEAANMLLQLYQRSEHWFRAPDVLYELEAMQIAPDEQLLNALLELSFSHRRLPHALQFLRRMSEANMRPAPGVVHGILKALLRQSEFDQASRILLQMPAWGQDPGPALYQRIFYELVPSWPRRAVRVLELMLQRGLAPDPKSLCQLLRSLAKASAKADAKQMMALLVQPENQLIVSQEHLQQLSSALSEVPPEWQLADTLKSVRVMQGASSDAAAAAAAAADAASNASARLSATPQAQRAPDALEEAHLRTVPAATSATST